MTNATKRRMSAEASDRYRRDRKRPPRSSWAYLHLRDLKAELRQSLSDTTGIWLDYGAHTSRYRGLFGTTQIETADISNSSATATPTYTFEPNAPCPAESERFDGILSTQVLEHVAYPQSYLQDAFRM